MMAPFSEVALLRWEERIWRIALAAAWPVGLSLALFIVTRNIPFCGFSTLYGLPCPFCGGTRACAALATLNLEEAWHYSPGIVVALGFAAVHTAFLLAEAFLARTLGGQRLWILGWKAIGCLVMVAWVHRLAIG